MYNILELLWYNMNDFDFLAVQEQILDCPQLSICFACGV